MALSVGHVKPLCNLYVIALVLAHACYIGVFVLLYLVPMASVKSLPVGTCADLLGPLQVPLPGPPYTSPPLIRRSSMPCLYIMDWLLSLGLCRPRVLWFICFVKIAVAYL